MPTLEVTHADGQRETVELAEELTFGRDPDCDVTLHGEGVSRRHARLWVDSADKVFVEDLGSSNGTLINGNRIDKRAPLLEGEVLTLGRCTIAIRGQRKSTPVPPSTPPAPRVVQDEGGWQLRGRGSLLMSKRFPVNRPVLVGRGGDVDLIVDHESVSRRHAQLEPTDDGVLVEDLGASNGTFLNGKQLKKPKLARVGDVVAFGSVDFVLENADKVARSSPRFPWVRMGLAGLVLSVLGVGVFAWMMRSAEPVPEEKISAARPRVPAGPSPLETALNECRMYSAPERSEGPDWERAAAACQRVLALDPLNVDALQLSDKVKLESQAAANLARAQKALTLKKESDALSVLSQIPPTSNHYGQAKALALKAGEQIRREEDVDCRRESQSRRWSQALRSCAKAMDVICQNMSPEQLSPPPRHKVKLQGKLRAKQWRPPQISHLRLLMAEEKLAPKARWSCPSIPILRRTEAAAFHSQQDALRAFQAQYSDPAWVNVLMDYWSGRGTKAQALRNDAGGRKLKKAVAAVEQLFKAGHGALQAEDLDKAAAYFRDALQLDSQLVPATLSAQPSYYRRAIQQDMAKAAYDKGVSWADRKDLKRACQFWRLGFSFDQTHPDLNKAVANACSAKAAADFHAAKTCDDLQKVLDYAVEGDGIEAKVILRQTELKCIVKEP